MHLQISKILLTITFLLIQLQLMSQSNDPKWDDTKNKNWPAECIEIEIPSTMDGKMQPAFFYNTKGEEKRPLIVSLHTWSGGYKQKDTLSWESIRRDYNYIHPHFRGPNLRPEACGSELAIRDIEDAIAYAIKNAPVDTNEIHVIGASGGGYATLFTYMQTKHPVKTFSAWVPISDIEKWYHESDGRGNKYALHIAKATVGNPKFNREYHYINAEEAHKRSPFYMATPKERRNNSKLYIYAGIHDGYAGSVPITQSLNFYNKLVNDYNPEARDELISQSDMLEMVTSRNFQQKHKEQIANRVTHYQRQYKDLIKLTIFEGGHEMLSEVALDHVKSKKVLILGDSNGAAEYGWANQLKNIRFDDLFYNTSISGNTIGFDNNGQQKLNTLRQVDTYLEKSAQSLNGLTDILILLGTNDCKAVFDSRLEEVPQNLETLIEKIKAHPSYKTHKPNIHIISPPPYGKDEIMREKYHGGAKRVAWLQPRFKEIAEKHGCTFTDVYKNLVGGWDYYAPDGIHPKVEAQRMIGELVSKVFE